MSEVFHYFPCLPAELQLEIWQHAAGVGPQVPEIVIPTIPRVRKWLGRRQAFDTYYVWQCLYRYYYAHGLDFKISNTTIAPGSLFKTCRMARLVAHEFWRKIIKGLRVMEVAKDKEIVVIFKVVVIARLDENIAASR